jgi:nicotinic acid mononucleotide adenylyltransferase
MDAYDLEALFSHRDILEGLEVANAPTLVPLEPAGPARSVALLAGSFNPPTAAHLLLAERARHEGFDAVFFVLARQTMGKDLAGLVPEDRLLALRTLNGRREIGIAVCSAGLYADQAEAATRLFPGADVAFLTGSDKVIQIFDERWYSDRAEALGRLFDRARLLVAPRASNGEQMRAVLDRPENRRWASHVSVLPLHPAVSDLSSTRVRGLLQAGADLCGLVPPPVAWFLSEIEAFSSPRMVGGEEVEPYRVRAELIDALWRAREWAESAADFRALVEVALGPSDEGKRMREALRAGVLEPDLLERAQASAR